MEVSSLLFSKAKKEAIEIHERVSNKYSSTVANVQEKCETLYTKRQQSIIKIEEIEKLINNIANTPKEFKRSLTLIETELIKFRETESYAVETYQNAVKSGAGMAVGVGAGVTTASLAPTAAIWVATTFGTASTGTAISTLSGAAASKAALAWLGGGALSAGGAGMAGGKALLALAGPIGWTIAGISVAGFTFVHAKNNKKLSKEIIEEAKEINLTEAELRKTGEFISNIYNETTLLMSNIDMQLDKAKQLNGNIYLSLSNDERLLLGALVNNTLSLAEILNKIAE